jgi:endo-1,4-beta-xylanase
MIADPPSRRLVLGAALALSACGASGQTPPSPVGVPPLKAAAPFPIGAAVSVGGLDDPAMRAALLANFTQITADWEMKMEVILQPDGTFDFSRPDAIAGFARDHRLRLHGHNLIWYIYRPEPFTRLMGDKAAFARAYANYILAVAGRYRGQAAGWDVVNEPVAEDGDGYRDCLWRQVFGMDYVEVALRQARQADPDAVLFLNEYNLESNPRKLASFLRLVEGLRTRGVPLDGIGTQMHLDVDQPLGAIRPTMQALAATGLKIHVSEFDVTLQGHDQMSRRARLEAQTRLAGEAAEAFAALPAAQRYAFSTWGVRDKDSWLRKPPNAGDGTDSPLLFDDEGRPKGAAAAFVRGVRGSA